MQDFDWNTIKKSAFVMCICAFLVMLGMLFLKDKFKADSDGKIYMMGEGNLSATACKADYEMRCLEQSNKTFCKCVKITYHANFH